MFGEIELSKVGDKQIPAALMNLNDGKHLVKRRCQAAFNDSFLTLFNFEIPVSLCSHHISL